MSKPREITTQIVRDNEVGEFTPAEGEAAVAVEFSIRGSHATYLTQLRLEEAWDLGTQLIAQVYEELKERRTTDADRPN